VSLLRDTVHSHFRYASGTTQLLTSYSATLTYIDLFIFIIKNLRFFFSGEEGGVLCLINHFGFERMQLGTISMENQVAEPERLKSDLEALKRVGVDGVMVDCWWGIVEGTSPQIYEWSGYRQLFSMVRDCQLKLQVRTFSFLSFFFLVNS